MEHRAIPMGKYISFCDVFEVDSTHLSFPIDFPGTYMQFDLSTQTSKAPGPT
jgi:hypothetical protein